MYQVAAGWEQGSPIDRYINAVSEAITALDDISDWVGEHGYILPEDVNAGDAERMEYVAEQAQELAAYIEMVVEQNKARFAAMRQSSEYIDGVTL